MVNRACKRTRNRSTTAERREGACEMKAKFTNESKPIIERANPKTPVEINTATNKYRINASIQVSPRDNMTVNQMLILVAHMRAVVNAFDSNKQYL
jgi:hypothetical protein